MAKAKRPTSDVKRSNPVDEQISERQAGEVLTRSEIVRANVNRRLEKSADFASLYANDAQVQTTPWDVRVTFGQIIGTPSEDDLSIVVKELAEVRMSPQFAKRVVMVLIGQLKHYEQTVGPIPLPPSDD